MIVPLLAQSSAEMVNDAAADGPDSSASQWHRVSEWATGTWAWFADRTNGWWEYLAAIVRSPEGRLILGAVLATVGLWLLMPGRKRTYSRVFGAAVGGIGAVCFLSLVPGVPVTATSLMFTLLSSLTVAAAAGTVTSKSPIYSAVWFAVTLLGVGGLLLVNGAQFIGIATIAVYAGAIVVTLLFVLMLAQPEGHTHYDRISWGQTAQWLGCAAGATATSLLVWALLATPAVGVPNEGNPVLVEDHVATLGGRLFTQHLLSVEVAGLLLFAALVGCVAIAAAPMRSRMAEQVESALSPDATSYRGDIRHE